MGAGFGVGGGRLARGEENGIWHRTSKMKVPRTGPQSEARGESIEEIGEECVLVIFNACLMFLPLLRASHYTLLLPLRKRNTKKVEFLASDSGCCWHLEQWDQGASEETIAVAVKLSLTRSIKKSKQQVRGVQGRF